MEADNAAYLRVLCCCLVDVQMCRCTDVLIQGSKVTLDSFHPGSFNRQTIADIILQDYTPSKRIRRVARAITGDVKTHKSS